jgi:hypothetical protein
MLLLMQLEMEGKEVVLEANLKQQELWHQIQMAVLVIYPLCLQRVLAVWFLLKCEAVRQLLIHHPLGFSL